MNIWAPQTEDDLDRILDHNEEHKFPVNPVELAGWIRQEGDSLAIDNGRSHRALRDGERFCHRNFHDNKRKQFIFVFRRATLDDVEILAVYSSNEEWDVSVRRRSR